MHSYFFVNPSGLQLIRATSEENANPSTQQRERSDEGGEVEWIDGGLFVGIAENTMNPLKKLKYWNYGDFGSRATKKA